MSRVLVLGATGSLGRHVLGQAIAAGHEVSVSVRTPGALPPEVRERIAVHVHDLAAGVPADLIGSHDAVISCAGHVTDGERFVAIVDRIVTAVEQVPAERQPVCWFLAGAAILETGAAHRAIDLPPVKATYWPHQVNFERLTRSRLDWRLLCPGPMVEEAPLGLDRLRISLEVLPVVMPESARALSPEQWLPVFASLLPEMIVPYADAAAVMLANLDREGVMSRRRVGLALPVGMRGAKATPGPSPVLAPPPIRDVRP